MARGHAGEVLGWLESRQEEMVGLLEQLALLETPSLVEGAQEPALALLESHLRGSGLEVRRVHGRHLYGRPERRAKGAPHQLVVGHVDTVWPLGTLAAMPVVRRGSVLHGPGVYDMKGGLVQLLFALRALAALELVPEVTPVVVVNSDEETGSAGSRRLIELLAAGAVRALVLEPPAGSAGALKTSRKGVGRFELKVHGRASHAGTEFAAGVSAIQELALQVQRLFALNDPAAGVTVNVGTIDGGLRPNVVAPEASALVDVRVPDAETAAEVEAAIRALAPALEGSSLEVAGGIGRPPMEPLPRNRELFRTARDLAAELGFDVGEAGLVGGASDANTTSRFTATLDGLGAPGAGAHAADEQVWTETLPPRTALLALLLLEPAPVGPERPARRRPARRPLVAVLGGDSHGTSSALAASWRALGIEAEPMPPLAARSRLRPGDLVLGRLDVLPTLDGVEPGLLELLLLERAGYAVRNSAAALLAAHDKLLTTRRLQEAGLPHPRAAHLPPDGPLPPFELPLVLKPRFGSWGTDVFRCETPAALQECLAEVGARSWFTRHGALLQEALPSCGYDLRIVVAAGKVVGAVERVARHGEWRTNTALGGTRRPADPGRDELELAVAAAAAVGGDLVGVDLLPLPSGGHTILEVNGAVDFDHAYDLDEQDVFARAARALDLPHARVPARAAVAPAGAT